MTDIATLGVRVDSGDLPRGEVALDRFAKKGEQTEKRITRSADRMERELVQTATAAQKLGKGFGGNGLRQASLQLSQVAQQGQVTGNYLQALAIQLPDLTLGFGPLGIAAGVAAGALLPFAANLLGAGDNSEDAAKALDTFAQSVTDYNTAAALAIQPTRDLREEFGQYGEEIRETLTLLQQFALSRALDGLTVAVEQIDVERLRFLVGVFEEGSAELDVLSANYNTALTALRDEFSLTGDQASQLLDSLNDLGQAEGPIDVATAAGAVNDILIDIYGSVQNIPPEMREMAQHLAETEVTATRLAANMEASDDAAATLATRTFGNIAVAANDAERLARFIRYAAQQNNNSLDVEDPRNPNGSPNIFPPERTFNSPEYDRALRGGRRSGGGASGASNAQRELNELNREAERIIEGLRSEQEIYNDNLAKAKELLDAGVLSQDQYNQRIAQLGEELESAKERGIDFGEAVTDSLADIVFEAENAKDALKGLLNTVGRSLFNTGFNSLFGDIGGAGGGFLSKLIPGFANGTNNAPGGLVSVHERGGEIMNLPKGTQIIPHDLSKRMVDKQGSRGGDVYNIDARGAQEGVAEQIAAALRRERPGMVQQAVSATYERAREVPIG